MTVLHQGEIKNSACKALMSNKCRKSLVQTFDIFGRQNTFELRQQYAVATLEC